MLPPMLQQQPCRVVDERFATQCIPFLERNCVGTHFLFIVEPIDPIALAMSGNYSAHVISFVSISDSHGDLAPCNALLSDLQRFF